MKPLSLFALLSIAASPALLAQDPVYTTPVGYVTETFKAGQYSMFGLTLHEAPIVTGTATSVTSSVVGDTSKNFTTILTSGQRYILEVTQANSTAYGAIAEIASFDATTLTVSPTNLSSVGFQSGETYQVRKAPTLADVFGATNQAGLLAGTSTTADILWISDGGGVMSRYFYATASFPITAGWRKVGGGNTDYSTLPLVYADGMIFQRRGLTDLQITFSGTIKTKPTIYGVSGGGVFNYLGASFPANSTLTSSGLQSQLVAGTSTSADVLWVPNGLGGYDRYYYATASFPITAGWRSIGGGNTDMSTKPIASGMILQRRGASANILLSPPSSYVNY